MLAAVLAIPVVSFVVSLIDGSVSGVGVLAGVMTLLILSLILFVVFLPAGVSVLSTDPVHTVDLGVFVAGLALAHGLNWLVRPLAESDLWLLAYPVASALATVVIRALVRSRGPDRLGVR